MRKHTRHRLYVASSWRNPFQAEVVGALRHDGHDVYDFKNPAPGDSGFSWRAVTDVPPGQWTADHFANAVLDHPVAARGFELDMSALDAASACVFVLPCGRSASLELGYAVGRGKLTIVFMPKLDEPELMYRMCDYVETTLAGVRRQLSRARTAPRWQRDVEAYDARAGGKPGNTYARAGEEVGHCRDYHHRICVVCGWCWRHGECTCGPVEPLPGFTVTDAKILELAEPGTFS